MSRNLPWSKEEIILALDLYFNPHRGSITSTNPNVIELSRKLNKLRATAQVNDEEKFRNPNGVSLKLSNFLAIDPKYAGEGMSSYSKLDAELFEKYSKNFSLLRDEVVKIKNSIK
jgi:5-methylcytosine-specific restriction protein A